MAAAYGWTPSAVADLFWLDVFEFVGTAERQHFRDLLWASQVAAHPNRKPADQRKWLEKLRSLADRPKRLKSAYDMVPDETRIGLIGSALSAAGERFASTHPAQMAWLAERGITPEEAIARHRAWLAKEMSHPGWVPANPKKPKKGKKKRGN